MSTDTVPTAPDFPMSEIERLQEQIENQKGAINRSWQRAQWLESERDALRRENDRLRANGAKLIGFLCDRCLLNLDAIDSVMEKK